MKKISGTIRRITSVLLFLPGLSWATKPFISMDFKSEEDGIVESAERNYAFHLGENVELLPDGPTGKPYLRFDGSKESTVRIDTRQAPSKLKGDEISVSFWFNVRDYRPCKIAYGFFSERAPNPIGESDYGRPRIFFSHRLAKHEFGQEGLWSGTEGPFPTNAWHHLAFTYSMSNDHCMVWFDGIIQQNRKENQEYPRPLLDILKAPMAETFPGGLSDIRIWASTVPDDVLMEMDVSPVHGRKMAEAFEKAAAAAPADLPISPDFRAWCAKKAARIRKLTSDGRADIREWMCLQRRSLQLPELSEHLQALAKEDGASTIGKLPGLPLGIDPYHMAKRLPFILPHDGKPIPSLPMQGAQGEIESTSFQFYPFRDIGKFHITPTDLIGPGGSRIPSQAIDIRVVKCWHADSGGWNTYYPVGRGYGTLTPELLLHDDALIKIDFSKRANYVRCNYQAGTRYVRLNEPGSPSDLPVFDIDREPVHDAAVFQPLPLENGSIKQFWITARIPQTARAGRYTGTLRCTADGSPCGSIGLTIDVRPFRLPRPSPKYNIDRPFLGTWMHHCSLAVKLNGRNLTNAIRRLRAEFHNMADHNMLHPWTSTYGSSTYPDLADIQLDLMEEAGLATRPLFGDMMGVDMPWILMAQYPGNWDNKIAVEDHPELFKERCNAYSNTLDTVLRKVEKRFGHREVYLGGMDEAGPGLVCREMPFFMIGRKLGAKAFITSGNSRRAAHALDANDAPAAFNRTLARNWHEGGAIITTYAAPFAGPENPAIWRRNKGVRLYFANYDGCNEYVWYEGEFLWNDNARAGKYRPFCIVYPTADGVLDTLAWEAMREGYDDVRYLTLLHRLARIAMRSGEKPLVRAGKTVTAWAESINPDAVDLVEMRAKASDWIARLQTLLQKKGVPIPDSVYR